MSVSVCVFVCVCVCVLCSCVAPHSHFSQVLRDVQSAQVMPFNLWPVASIRQYLQTLEPLGERTLLDESYRLEPKATPVVNP